MIDREPGIGSLTVNLSHRGPFPAQHRPGARHQESGLLARDAPAAPQDSWWDFATEIRCGRQVTGLGVSVQLTWRGPTRTDATDSVRSRSDGTPRAPR